MAFQRGAVGSNRIDLSGQRFGMLVVSHYTETRGSRAWWLCKCDCGGTKEISSHRGITVCKEWASDMKTFIAWCESKQPIPTGYTLDRRDNSGDYSPGNCHFVSKSEQQRNSRRYKK